MIDPDQLAEDERAREALSSMAALAGHFADALHAAKVPDAVAHQMLIDWHWAVITDGVAWEQDDEG